MENDKITNENKNAHPKPTDEVQKEIETVVPSAHQAEVTPGKSETPVDIKEDQPTDEPTKGEGNKVTEGEEGAEKAATATDQSGTDEASSPEENTPEEEETNDAANAGEDDNKDSDHEHNGIETVTP
ncbi:hypothetical protein [Pedobacter sp. AJM]|jgi:hypothetical protein|uniref:hypothetical protein n=1 Tax=Pedobacter TaxID=84567 RepID=UPI000B4BD083|nr:hypothetical protein [Pedobacter sp. AJM]OWK71655.1 hypothetical protein CBW18_04070 [Pedobacter sp. AJM]